MHIKIPPATRCTPPAQCHYHPSPLLLCPITLFHSGYHPTACGRSGGGINAAGSSSATGASIVSCIVPFVRCRVVRVTRLQVGVGVKRSQLLSGASMRSRIILPGPCRACKARSSTQVIRETKQDKAPRTGGTCPGWAAAWPAAGWRASMISCWQRQEL